MARAGGSFGRRLRWWVLIFVGPAIGIYAAVVTYYLTKKRKECATLLRKIEETDALWSPDLMKRRVQKTFFKIQEAWAERDQSICRDYVSDKLFEKHKYQTDQLIKLGHKNVMKNISLDSAAIVEIADYENDDKDNFVAYIKGSMIDYLVDEKSGKLLEGEKERTSFDELWKFTRTGNDWKLDEIEADVSIEALSSLSSFSELFANNAT